MSILQDYETIRDRMKAGEFDAIERYLKAHPHILLSDLYYNEERYKEFFIWWKKEDKTQEVLDEVNEETNSEGNVQIYVDGSYSKTTKKTGAGIVIVYDDNVLKKSFTVDPENLQSWNVDAECHASLEALKICTGESLIEGMKFYARDITINYDYAGIEKWITREWKAKSKIARFYTEEFHKLMEKYNVKVSFNKIKAHTGDLYNEMADELAKQAIV